MRIAVISHTYVLEANRGKPEALARLPGLEVLLVVPRTWRNRDLGQRSRAQVPRAGPLSFVPLRSWSFGSGSLIAYAPLALFRLLRRFQADLIHLEEEPWSFAALELSLFCLVLGVPLTFFTWENIDRRLLLPFRLIRRWLFRRAVAAVAGNAEAKALLQRRGSKNAVTVLPQLGVDASSPRGGEPQRTVVGYVGRLVPQKGLFVLLEAVARLTEDVRVMVVGSGPLKVELLKKAQALRLDGRLELHEGVPHPEVPQYLQQMTVLVLPSLTTPRWKEQFGHVLVEAMACGVPVIGSDSGAIPEVIGDAGLVVPEGDVGALAEALRRLVSTPGLRTDLASRGRGRVLADYTNGIIARRLAAFWQDLVSDA